MVHRLTKVRKLAAEADGLARGCDKIRNQSTRFSPGDLVLVKFSGSRPGRSTKLQPRQQGPFRIVEVEHGVTALLQNVQRPKDTLRRHFSHLVPFRGTTESPGDDEWEVECIVDEEQAADGHLRYLVRWKGYPEPSWVTAEDLHAPALLREWRKKSKDKKVEVARFIDKREGEEGVEFLVAIQADVGPEDYVWLPQRKINTPIPASFRKS